MEKKVNLLSLQIQFLRQEIQALIEVQPSTSQILLVVDWNLRQVTSRLKNELNLKKLKTRVMVRKVMPSLSKMVSLPSEATNTGAFYATRTLLQIEESNLQNGEIRDFPKFQPPWLYARYQGRKFIPYDTALDIMLNMAYYKMNDLQLHLNDNYIFLKEHLAGKNLTQEEELKYVLEHAKTGFRVETDIVGKNGQKLTSDEHYTKEEMQNLIKLAKALYQSST